MGEPREVARSRTTTSNTVTIGDTGSNISTYDSVFVLTHISVGGVIVFGFFRTSQASANTYTINLTDTLGDPLIPTTAVANGGVVAEFDTTAGSAFVDVTLPNHGFAVGDTFPILVSTSVGGVTLFGNYIITEVPTSSTFIISASQEATTTANAFINGGDAAYDYYYSFGALILAQAMVLVVMVLAVTARVLRLYQRAPP